MASANIRHSLNAHADFSVADGSRVNGKFSLKATITDRYVPDSRADHASAEVAINLEPQKYYILSATPVGGYQTAFVVQLIEGL